ncbi:uracil-DNA glycosylase [Acidithiobacillus sp.]|uniref:uracil-DNA glycosylase n=1 Tax=Acidithiobacillus sp. TaxID=1872118 RepID=UPI003D0529AD
MTCIKCSSLRASRTQIVEPDQPEFGRPCKVLVIGEAPGADEDAQGKGFVGRAGRTLHALMEEHGLRRGFDYGCANVVRCRPPENRKPTKAETETCLPLLVDFLEKVQPRAILLVGGTPTSIFCGTGALSVRIQQCLDGRQYSDLAHDIVQPYLERGAPRLFAMPHTSPLAWNRNAPDGRKWSAVGADVIAELGRWHRDSSSAPEGNIVTKEIPLESLENLV